jgi:hypothetical protein
MMWGARRRVCDVDVDTVWHVMSWTLFTWGRSSAMLDVDPSMFFKLFGAHVCSVTPVPHFSVYMTIHRCLGYGAGRARTLTMARALVAFGFSS